MKQQKGIFFMMKIKCPILFFILLITSALNLAAQDKLDSVDVQNELKFLNYLVSSQQNNEALYLLKNYENYDLFKPYTDSLSFLKGKIFYNQNKLNKSIESFNKISSGFLFKNPVKALTAYEYAQIGKYNESLNVLNSLKTSDNKLFNELVMLQKAAVFLLQGNLKECDNYFLNNDTTFNELLVSQQNLNDYLTRVKKHKNKSPFVAGLFSALIPGTGKMYAGKIGEGFSTLLGMSIVGAIVYENYTKAGIKNYKTIGFGSLFAIFYAANIYGSVYSVKVYRQEFNKSINHAILFNMHIPVRNVFPELFN